MRVDGKTRIDDLLNRYPYLEEFLPTLSDEYKLVQNRFLRKTIGKLATVERAASIGGFEVSELLAKIRAKIKAESGEDVGPAGEIGTEAAQAKGKREAIKDIIRRLHDGADPDSLKSEFSAVLEDIGAYELSQIEQELIEEGLPVEEVQRMCNLHERIFSEGLKAQSIPGIPAGHPVQIMLKENRELEKRVFSILQETDAGEIKAKLEDLKVIELHYVRKENQLFPVLEERGVTGPSQVMWGKHDEIRALFKKAQSEDPVSVKTLNSLTLELTGMITKEEKILFPMALEILSDEDWQKVKSGEHEIGYCWIEPDEQWTPEVKASDVRYDRSVVGDVNLEVGHMSPELLNLMLCHLPIEISMVNSDDEVVYYSQTKERIFPRTPAVIGRKVQNCHPQSSVHVVNEILDAFKKGEKDVAEFWIQMKGMFLNIRYFAIRDKAGAYRGCLEVTQDVSHIRSLEGERRLLDWS